MVAICHQLGLDACLEALSAEVERCAEAIRGADFSASVPTCPDWTLADLISHVGSVHRWAANHVRILSPKRIPSSEMEFGLPGAPSGFADWLLAGRDDLIKTLQAADQDAPMWAWGADKHARFWPRRQLHETAIHRADAELTLGIEPHIADAVAADGVDEFLDNAPCAEYFAPNVAKLRGDGESIFLNGGDVSWLITLEPEKFVWNHGSGDAAVTVDGSLADLNLLMWGRRKPGDGLAVHGDQALLSRWIENSSL